MKTLLSFQGVIKHSIFVKELQLKAVSANKMMNLVGITIIIIHYFFAQG